MKVRELGHEGASLALRAPLIQRKRAHSFSTGARITLALIATAGCAGRDTAATPSGEAMLKPDLLTIRVGPGETGFARVVMTNGDRRGRVPVGSASVSFSINDAPLVPGTTEPGAALAATTATTDVSGVATIGVSVDERVGLATAFSIHATAGIAHADVTVLVADKMSGSVEVAPFFPNPETPFRATGGIILRFVDRQRCADLDPYHPPDVVPARLTMPMAPGETARFDYVTPTRPAAALGRANNEHGELIALGCIDLPEGTVLPDGLVAVALPLRDAVPSPVGRFAVNSPMTFRPPLPAAAAISARWRDLSDCPLDPAQLLLDCIIDALSPETAADPLDCSPNLAPGGEGPLGDALMARRGLLIANAAGAVTSCRAAQDRLGAPSLDAIALGLFGTPTPPLVIALPAIAADAARILDSVTLSSTLDVQATGRPDEFIVTHTLDSATFAPRLTTDPGVTVALAPLALPSLTATTTATTRGGLLSVDDHGFSLRLGRIALAAFNMAALAPRLSPQTTADTDGLIAELVKLAHAKDEEDSDVAGCAAFNALLCPIAGGGKSCLLDACSGGLGALIARLRGAFDAANGSGLDFYLAGSAPVLNTQGGASAHQLGSNLETPTAPATWSVDLQTAAGRTQLSTSFVGIRE
jgi:hypothetical protein